MIALIEAAKETSSGGSWPAAFAIAAIAASTAVVLVAWFKWGKDAYNRDRATDAPPEWRYEITKTTHPTDEGDRPQ